MYENPESKTLNHPVRRHFGTDTGALEPRAIVQKIFANEGSIYEKRLQALAFISQLEWISEHNSETDTQLSTA